MLLANEMEVERDHALDRPENHAEEEGFGLDDSLMEAANREEKASGELQKQKFEALESQASFDRVLFDGGEFGTGGELGSEDEQDFLGIPGLLDPDQVTMLLRQRQQEQLSRRGRKKPEEAVPEQLPSVADHRHLTELRAQLAKNVSAWSARSGMPHGVVHSELRRICGGPAVAQANEEQLQKRLAKLQDWFIGRK